MKTCLDANVISSFYAEAVGHSSKCTAPAADLIQSAKGAGEPCLFMDDGGKMQHEYEECCSVEWVRVLIEDLLIEGVLVAISAKKVDIIAKQLDKIGMPKSRDRWYIWTAHAALDYFGVSSAQIVSEDLDFFEPTFKQQVAGDMRRKILLNDRSVMQIALRKHQIYVRAVRTAALPK